MSEDEKREEGVADRGPSSSASQTAGPGGRRRPAWVTGVGLIVLLVGLAAVFLVYRPDGTGYPNTIADGAADAEPEVAPLLQEAGQVVDRLLERFPDGVEALDTIAWAHQRFGKTQDAVAYWQKCVELDPRFASAHHSLGLAAQTGGDLGSAVACFRKAAEVDPGTSRHSAALGESLLNLGELEEAARVLEKDLQVHPKSTPSLILVGQVYVRLRQYEKARQYLETAIEMAPDYTSAYYGLGTACAKLGDREKAKEYLDRFKVLKARDEQAHRDELKAADDVADVRTGLAEVYTAAGKVYLAHADVAAAQEHLGRASQLDPDFLEPRQVLAWLYQRQGRTDEALRELAALEQQATGDPALCRSLGEMYSQWGMFDKAERAYQKLVEISPRRGGGYAALVKLYLQANRKIAEARLLAQKAVELEPVAPYYFMLALACQRAGDRAGALVAIEGALARDAGNPEYQRLREMMEKQPTDGARPFAP